MAVLHHREMATTIPQIPKYWDAPWGAAAYLERHPIPQEVWSPSGRFARAICTTEESPPRIAPGNSSSLAPNGLSFGGGFLILSWSGAPQEGI